MQAHHIQRARTDRALRCKQSKEDVGDVAPDRGGENRERMEGEKGRTMEKTRESRMKMAETSQW